MDRDRSTWRRTPLPGPALLLAIGLLAACGSDDGEIAEGGECQPCRDKAPQCDAGMTCERFQGNFTYALCAKSTTQQCKVPF